MTKKVTTFEFSISLITLLMVSLTGCSKSKPQKVTEPAPIPITATKTEAKGSTANKEFLWLEDLHSDRSSQWVSEMNLKSQNSIEADPRFKELFILMGGGDSKSKPAKKSKANKQTHSDQKSNSDQNSKSTQSPKAKKKPKRIRRVRGTVYSDYIFSQKKIEGTTYLVRYKFDEVKDGINDKFEKLTQLDHLKWKNKPLTYSSIYCKSPRKKDEPLDLCLISFSLSGTDSTIVREFSISNKSFIGDGFNIDVLAYNIVYYRSKDEVVVSTNFGEGSLNSAKRPRIKKIWKRGQKLSEATKLTECGVKLLNCYELWVNPTPEQSNWQTLWVETIARDSYQIFRYDKKQKGPKLELPSSLKPSAQVGPYYIFHSLKDSNINNNSIKPDSIVAIPVKQLIDQSASFAPISILEASGSHFVRSVRRAGKNGLLAVVGSDSKDQLLHIEFKEDQWIKTEIILDTASRIDISRSGKKGTLFVSTQGYLRAPKLYLYDTQTKEKMLWNESYTYKSRQNVITEKHYATSKDGTKVPFVVIRSAESTNNGKNPTWINGYGGFRISLANNYISHKLPHWIDKGGVYVDAFIRGGGEFGSRWHRSASLDKKKKSYEDFAAVAEALISLGVTSSNHIGIAGSSNGGLLTTATMAMRPELFKAVISSNPLIDMTRYLKLSNGPMWIDEYGDPEVSPMREYIRSYSPMQNIEAGRVYPRVLLTTSTNDDRVHPGHARRFAARLENLGYDPLYYEAKRGGHAGAFTAKEWARKQAYHYTHFYRELMGDPVVKQPSLAYRVPAPSDAFEAEMEYLEMQNWSDTDWSDHDLNFEQPY